MMAKLRKKQNNYANYLFLQMQIAVSTNLLIKAVFCLCFQNCYLKLQALKEHVQNIIQFQKSCMVLF